jgi:hypothetical protein
VRKQDVIELYQTVLASGDVPNDIMGRYSYQTISGVLSEVCKSIFALDANFGDQMSQDVSITMQKTGSKYFCELDVFPMNGSQGIRAIMNEEGTMRYYGRQGVTEDILAGILGGVNTPQWTLSGNKIFWSKKGGGWVTTGDEPTTLIAKVVIDVDDMDDDAPFISEEYSEIIMQKVIQFIGQNNIRPTETINDTKQDAG